MGHRVIQFDLARAEELRERLERDGFRMREIQHALFGATKPGISVTLYRRGKLVVQGNGIEMFLEQYFPEEAAAGGGAGDAAESVLGTDESGKGDYFGPLVVAGVLVPAERRNELRARGVADCKNLSDLTVLRLSDWICETLPCARVALGPEEYNRRYEEVRNLNRILASLHAKVILEISSKHPCDRVLTDQFGDESLVRNALGESVTGMHLEQRPAAESETAVAAASIVARAEFLRQLQELQSIADTELPKGASLEVERVARDLVALRGKSILRRVAKLHFKTTQKLGSLFG
jgi:ribonuclease HIII